MSDTHLTHITLGDIASIPGARALSDAEMAGIYGGKSSDIKLKDSSIKKDIKLNPTIKLDSGIKIDKGAPPAVKLNPAPKASH